MKKNYCFLLLLMSLLCACNRDVHLWRIQENGLYGFIDSLGNVVIEPQYKYVSPYFIKDYALVISSVSMSSDSIVSIRYGYINTDNELAVDTTNTYTISAMQDSSLVQFVEDFNNQSLNFNSLLFPILELRDDRYVFMDNETYLFGYKNSEGKIVIKPMFKIARQFSNERAVVMEHVDTTNISNILDCINNFGIIDKDGTWIIEGKYATINDYAMNKKTWASIISVDDNYVHEDWFLLDKDGKVLTPSKRVKKVYNSKYGVYLTELNDLFGKEYTFMDDEGNYLTDFNKDGMLEIGKETMNSVVAFSQGYAGIKGQANGVSAWFFVNKDMQTNYVPYDSVLFFTEGLAAVREFKTGEKWIERKWGFIDTHANVVIPYQFSSCLVFKGALAYFKQNGSAFDIEGYINKKGKVVWQIQCKKK